MSDLLSIARSGVTAYARALEVVADNVANAGTAGHVRRLSTISPALRPGSSSPLERDPIGGSGVRLTAITRAADALRTDTLRRAEGQVYALDAGETWLTQVQSILTGANALDKPIASFFASASDLAADPTSNAVRATFLSSASVLADRFNGIAQGLAEADKNIQLEAGVQAQALTGLAKSLAEVNAQLRRAGEGSGTAATLADERDRVLAGMATYASFDVTLDARGQATVRVPDAGGPALVEGDFARAATVSAEGGGLALRIGDGATSETATMTGGSLAGLSNARGRIMQAIEGVDSLADRIAAEVNAAHSGGVDLNGDSGLPIFATHKPVVSAAAANGGTARLNAELAEGAMPPALTLHFDGAQWTLARADLSAATSGALPLTLDGVTIESPGGTARNGDLFRIETVSGAAGISATALDPSQVAAAAGWLAEADSANAGTATVTVRTSAAAATPSASPWQVEALDDGTVELRDSLGALLASGQPGDWMEGDGFAVRISGAPLAGDLFHVEPTGAGDGGNANALALLTLRDTGGPAGTIGDQHDLIVNRVAVPLNEVRNRLEAATANRDAAAEILNQVSGVDLNTEAAEMLRLQQAYQANSRIIQTARETFDALLNATA